MRHVDVHLIFWAGYWLGMFTLGFALVVAQMFKRSDPEEVNKSLSNFKKTKGARR